MLERSIPADVCISVYMYIYLHMCAFYSCVLLHRGSFLVYNRFLFFMFRVTTGVMKKTW